jgi:ferredoxin
MGGCAFHPGIEVVARCKQCGRGVCAACVVKGSTGVFCSAACKERHEAFAQRARELEGRARVPIFTRLRNLIGWVIVALAVCLALGVVGSVFPVPFLTPIVYQVRAVIGI